MKSIKPYLLFVGDQAGKAEEATLPINSTCSQGEYLLQQDKNLQFHLWYIWC
ncbi:MAG: hypothetical protein KUG81_05125 [Gammaproteobacteria bacterium]|nr:hypothetical protein [Gammaproteobacteria bacterium]